MIDNKILYYKVDEICHPIRILKNIASNPKDSFITNQDFVDMLKEVMRIFIDLSRDNPKIISEWLDLQQIKLEEIK